MERFKVGENHQTLTESLLCDQSSVNSHSVIATHTVTHFFQFSSKSAFPISDTVDTSRLTIPDYGNCPLHWMMFIRFPGFCPQDATLMVMTKSVSRLSNVPWRQNDPKLRTLGLKTACVNSETMYIFQLFSHAEKTPVETSPLGGYGIQKLPSITGCL